LRLVLDTHVWLDWLVFEDPAVRPIFDGDAFQILINPVCEAELHRVLTYDFGKWTLDEARRDACASACRARALFIEERDAAEFFGVLPRCRDPDDQKFLELALAARADCLLTRDSALLELAHRVSAFRIMAPQALLKPDA
jgi:predicted nucleic acid-binding protein